MWPFSPTQLMIIIVSRNRCYYRTGFEGHTLHTSMYTVWLLRVAGHTSTAYAWVEYSLRKCGCKAPNLPLLNSSKVNLRVHDEEQQQISQILALIFSSSCYANWSSTKCYSWDTLDGLSDEMLTGKAAIANALSQGIKSIENVCIWNYCEL